MRKPKPSGARPSPDPARCWSGPFSVGMDPAALEYSSSLAIDRRLYREDIAGSIAHAEMLARKRLLSTREKQRIVRALREIERECENGSLFSGRRNVRGERFVADDIHMLIEQRLTEKVGAAGGKLHTGRSRNDQIALDERLFLRAGIDEIAKRLTRLQRALVLKADRYRNLVVPGYTHLQQAQPILHAHHLLAYVEMLERDRERMADCRRRVNCSPLGAAALAGTTLPLDRAGTARALGFKGLLENSIDAVSDRDVQIEFLAAGAITMMHLSRLAEEFVLWSSAEWGFAGIGEEYTTGSSIMPQKRNPDIAELLRGKTGRAYGNLMALLTVMKGLPLAYNRDMQEDKLPLFDTVDTLTKSLEVTSGMVASTEFRERTGFAGGSYDQMLATDLAEYLVTKGIPFREAHAIVGKLVRDSERSTSPLSSFTLAGLRAYSPSFGKDVLSLLDVMRSPGHKRSEGSTSPVHVHRAIGRWKGKLSRRKE